MVEALPPGLRDLNIERNETLIVGWLSHLSQKVGWFTCTVLWHLEQAYTK